MENFLEIVRGAYQGEVVLPEFHHPFVWGRKDIEELLASVLQGCFVGTFLMVDTSPGKPLFLFRLVEGLAQVNGQANPKQHSTVRLVLDGQQRITAAFYALYAPPVPLRDDERPYRFYLHLEPMLEGDLDEAVVGVSTEDERRLEENRRLVREHRALPFTKLADPMEFYRNEGVWGSYSAPVFKPGVHGLPHLH